jgi:hypothetical protein
MAEHKMPAGIKRVQKGIYRTLDERHEIRQGDDGWTVESAVDGSPFKSRGLAVQKLAELGLLPTEAPKPEEPAQAAEREEQPRQRPRTRKQPAEAVPAIA